MAKRLKILDSAKVAYRQSWDDRREIFQVSWLVVLLSFGLLAIESIFPFLFSGMGKYVLHFADEALISVIFVGLLRKNLLGEMPELKKLGKISFYLRFGRREGLYALWIAAQMLLAFLFGKAASIAENLPFLGPLVAELVWPLVRDLLLAMLILIGPYIAVTPKPAASDLTGLVEAVIGNIAHIMIAVLVISAPYYILSLLYHHGLDWIKGGNPVFRQAFWYGLHAVYCICAIVKISFMTAIYKNLYAAQPPPLMPR